MNESGTKKGPERAFPFKAEYSKLRIAFVGRCERSNYVNRIEMLQASGSLCWLSAPLCPFDGSFHLSRLISLFLLNCVIIIKSK